MVKFLADSEYSHQIKATAEYDMLVKFPTYYEGTAEPGQEKQGLRKEER